jgi:aminopeptidase N
MHRVTALCTGALAIASVSAAIEHADIDLTVRPDNGTITVSAEIRVALQPGDTAIELLLNRRLDVSALQAGVPITGFEHDRTGPGPYQYAPQATSLTIHLAEPATGTPAVVDVRASGAVEPDEWGVVQVTPRWVELEAVYSGWFPFAPGADRFDVQLQAHLPDGWLMTGTGRPTLEDGVWVSAAQHVQDVVVLASPDLRRLPVGDALTLWHVDLPDGAPERIVRDTEKVRATLEGWLGTSVGGHVDLVFAPRTEGGGFARPGLVVMLYDDRFYQDDDVTPVFLRYLAHEVSHLWWRQAPTTTWQDWLNESFAEMSALMLLRKRFGEEVFAEKVAAYREASTDAPPIRGLARHHEQAFATLYRKGPVLLADLEASIGRDAFLRFLRALADRKMTSTAECLDTLEEVVSADARAQLERGLER